MPYTIAQIAEGNGVSKTYVRKMLVRHGLLEGHTTTEGGRGTIYIDDEAASAVSHYISQEVAKRTAQLDMGSILQPEPEVEVAREKTQTELYEDRIADLKAQIADLQRQRDELQERSAAQQAEFMAAVKALPSAGEVEDARVEGEERGRSEEREKIASMGFFARMRYLRG